MERGRRRFGTSIFLAAFVWAGFLSSGAAWAHDPAGDDGDGGEPAEPILRLRGFASLSPPEGAADTDAAGSVRLRQRGERMALHVRVRELEPGATYGVLAARTVEGDGGAQEETQEVGSITTHDGVAGLPRCFRTGLRPPPPPPEGEGDGDGDAGEGEADGGGADHRHRTSTGPSGFAVVFVASDSGSARYQVRVRGLEDPVVGLRILLSDGTVIELDAAAREATVALAEGQHAAIAAGGALLQVLTAVEGEEPAVALQGDLDPCFSDEWRERFAARRAGRGALRLDTERGDSMPFGVTTIRDLVGVTFRVLDAGGAVVLAGTVEEVVELVPPPPPEDGDGGGAGFGEVDDDPFAFALDEPHDASFLRGDATDDGSLDISDPMRTLWYLYQGGAEPYCADAMDADDDGIVSLSDCVLTLGHLFQQGPPLAQPYPRKGFDRTADALLCASYGS